MEDLKADIWFPTLIWHKKVTAPIKEVTKYALTLKDNTKGVSLSNHGGWQSENTTVPPEHIELAIELDQAVKACCQQAGLPPLKLFSTHFCVNGYGDYNIALNHEDAVLSGILHLHIPDEECGDTVFYRDDDSKYHIPVVDQYNNFTSQEAKYSPEIGKLLLFPSWMKHRTEGSRSNGERVTMAFSYGVR